MEKELIINGIKYIKYEESKSYKIYDLVKYNGYEWIVINVKEDRLTLMMKNCLSKEKMKEIFNNNYLDKDFDIKYSLDKTCIFGSFNSCIMSLIDSTGNFHGCI